MKKVLKLLTVINITPCIEVKETKRHYDWSSEVSTMCKEFYTGFPNPIIPRSFGYNN